MKNNLKNYPKQEEPKYKFYLWKTGFEKELRERYDNVVEYHPQPSYKDIIEEILGDDT